MDSGISNSNQFQNAIKEQLRSGELTVQEASRRLMMAVEVELRKPSNEIRKAYIKACQSLLFSLNAPRIKVDVSKKNLELERRFDKRRRARQIRHKVVATMGLAVAMFIVIIIGEGVLYRQWFSGTPSVDEQQYEVMGHVANSSLVESGHAGTAHDVNEITSTDFNAVTTVLGYTPTIPSWFADEWNLVKYYASVQADVKWFRMDISIGDPQDLIKYEVVQYASAKDAYLAFEQNEQGELIHCNGWDVYLSQNIERTVAIWWETNTCYYISGPISHDDLVGFIESIQKE